MHLTSQVSGTWRRGGRTRVLGNVGAPKVRAMEIIDELEPVDRGPTVATSVFDWRGNSTPGSRRRCWSRRSLIRRAPASSPNSSGGRRGTCRCGGRAPTTARHGLRQSHVARDAVGGRRARAHDPPRRGAGVGSDAATYLQGQLQDVDAQCPVGGGARRHRHPRPDGQGRCVVPDTPGRRGPFPARHRRRVR